MYTEKEQLIYGAFDVDEEGNIVFLTPAFEGTYEEVALWASYQPIKYSIQPLEIYPYNV